MKGIITAYSANSNVDKAVQEVKDQLGGLNSKLVLFFASTIYQPDEISGKMQEAFGSVPTFGCSTAGEIVNGLVLKNSLVAMAIGSDVIGDFKRQGPRDLRDVRLPQPARPEAADQGRALVQDGLQQALLGVGARAALEGGRT